MAKVELSITAEALPGWGLKEGVRELIQNGRDAERQFDAPFDVTHEGSVLTIRNKRTTLPHEALLIGYTTKTSRTDMIGRFGEGLKFGVLALVRAGHPVTILSGDEIWKPSIQDSDKYKSRVLCMDITKNPKAAGKNRVSIEIGKINRQEWEKMKPRFLFLEEEYDATMRFETSEGQVLLEPQYKGGLFVKGIKVEDPAEEALLARNPQMVLRYGYNLTEAEIDRDRKMVARWDRDARIASMWFEALATEPRSLELFVELLFDSTAPDLGGIETHNVKHVPEKVIDALVDGFVKKHGELAIPVLDANEAKAISHFGRTGVIVPQRLCIILQSRMGTVAELQRRLHGEIVEKHPHKSLEPTEQLILRNVVMKVGAVRSLELQNVDVVTFRNKSLMGLYNGGRIALSRSLLKNRREALKTLVHEVAHRKGPDGDQTHVAEIEDIWADIESINNQ